MAIAPEFSEFSQAIAAAEGVTVEELLKLLQKNASSKQYNWEFMGIRVTETTGDKSFFLAQPMTWYGVPYSVIVAMEKRCLKMLTDMNHLGAEIATGGAVENQPK